MLAWKAISLLSGDLCCYNLQMARGNGGSWTSDLEGGMSQNRSLSLCFQLLSARRINASIPCSWNILLVLIVSHLWAILSYGVFHSRECHCDTL